MNRKNLAMILVLLILAAAFACAHLLTRTPDEEGGLLINGEPVSFVSLNLEHVEGMTVNGKGEEKTVSGQGICLSELWQEDFSAVTVRASDEYSAVVQRDEIGNAFLLISDEELPRLVVFGDTNSKRNVRNVTELEFTK